MQPSQDKRDRPSGPGHERAHQVEISATGLASGGSTGTHTGERIRRKTRWKDDASSPGLLGLRAT